MASGFIASYYNNALIMHTLKYMHLDSHDMNEGHGEENFKM